jgi:S1-C subfamily serine protease
MKIIVTAIMVLALANTAGATDWSANAEKLAKSVVYIETADGSCTGFVINSDAKNEKDYVLTAAHCDGSKLYADGSDARVIYKDLKKDLMVLEVEDTGRPAVMLAKNNPKPGDELASYGYGYGFERPMLRITHVADDNTHIDQDGVGGPFIVTDATFVPGQSGGPVINAAGEVAMMVQLGSNAVGFGVGAEVMRSKVSRYFEKVQ